MRAALVLSAFAFVVPLAPGQMALADATTAAPQARPVIGLGFWLVDGGIEVNDVSKGSAAEKAGLKVGMLITQINGTQLSEMGITEIEQMVAALQGEIILKVRELGEVRMRKAPLQAVGS